MSGKKGGLVDGRCVFLGETLIFLKVIPKFIHQVPNTKLVDPTCILNTLTWSLGRELNVYLLQKEFLFLHSGIRKAIFIPHR